MSDTRAPSPERDPGVEEILRSRRVTGPISRKLPGPIAWFDVRARSTGHLAFSLNRITGLGLVFYLYLHLAVLSLLLGGEGSWSSFLEIATTPLFLGFDVLLVFGLLFTVSTARACADRQRTRRRTTTSAVLGAHGVGAIVLVYAAIHVFTAEA